MSCRVFLCRTMRRPAIETAVQMKYIFYRDSYSGRIMTNLERPYRSGIIWGCLLLFLSGCSFNPFAPKRTRVYSVIVTVSGNGTTAGSSSLSQIKDGSTVTLTASPDSGSVFVSWGGDIRQTDNPLILTVTRNLSLVCTFGKKPPAMVPIGASGKTFVMGSADAASSVNEHPAHSVSFTYNYFLGACEVTQGDYQRVMGTNPAQSNATQGTAGIGDNFPVYYVRWYDAVLYCNARSKMDGFDTVYSYTAQCGATQDCPYTLENLATHFDRLGYRLPTEAEWEYACRAGATTDYFWGSSDSAASTYAWYFANSLNQTQPVGQKRPNAFGLYDMTGNVAEWVNDWLGAYGDSAVVNPIGPTGLPLAVYESSWQRPIRGGCYSLGTEFLRSSNRGGPYPETATTI